MSFLLLHGVSGRKEDWYWLARPLFRRGCGYLAVDLPPGSHAVEATYDATPSKDPLLVLGVVALALAAILRRRLDRPAAWVAQRLHASGGDPPGAPAAPDAPDVPGPSDAGA